MAYIPNKAIHPGRTLAEILDREGMTQKSLSERTGISEKHLSQIINGEVSLTVDTALALENVLGGSASFWLNLEKNYQETRARLDRMATLAGETEMLARYPYKELARRRYVEDVADKEKKVENLWKFFGVNSLSYVSTTESVAFRKTVRADDKGETIAAWLRCGELEAKKQNLPEYSETKLRQTLSRLKLLSVESAETFSREIVKLLNEAGVALVFVEHFRGTGVSGAVRWINKTPAIQLSLYYSWADIFWFNLYHEIAHLLLHGKKEKFIEFEKKGAASSHGPLEDEADRFAGNELIPEKIYRDFVDGGAITRSRIITLAEKLGIHPGIVAGRLCHDKRVTWNVVSSLRVRLRLSAS